MISVGHKEQGYDADGHIRFYNHTTVRKMQIFVSKSHKEGRKNLAGVYIWGSFTHMYMQPLSLMRGEGGIILKASTRRYLEDMESEGIEIPSAIKMLKRFDAERDIRSMLDVLARRYGANTLLQDILNNLDREIEDFLKSSKESSGEERKKDTDEVDGSTQTGDETHGGDSASGEVPDSQSGGGESESEPESKELGEGSSSTGTGDGSESQDSGDDSDSPDTDDGPESQDSGDDSDSPDTGDGSESKDPGGGSSSTGTGDGSESQDSGDDSDSPDTGDGSESQDSGDDSDSPDTGDGSESKDSGDDSDSPDTDDGSESKDSGDDSDPPSNNLDALKREFKKSLRASKRNENRNRSTSNISDAEFGKLDMALVRRARAAFAGLVSAGSNEYSSRYDHNELVKRMITHRPLQPAKREEFGRPVILVIADISGSCDAFSEPACDVAQACGALGVPGADILTVRSGNPFNVIETRLNNKPLTIDWAKRGSESVVQFFYNFISKELGLDIQVVIGLGDDDEFYTYETFASFPSVERMIWLDNYRCSELKKPLKRAEIRPISRASRGEKFRGAAHRKLTYIIGCGDAKGMVTGLEIALRNR